MGFIAARHTQTAKQNSLFSIFNHIFFFLFRKLERHETNEKKNCAQNIFHYVIFEHDAGWRAMGGGSEQPNNEKQPNSRTTKQPNNPTTEVATAGKVPCIQRAEGLT